MLPALIAVAYVLLQIVGKPALLPSNDAYFYARATLEILGDSRKEAAAEAKKALCGDQARRDVRLTERNPLALAKKGGRPHGERQAQCVAQLPNKSFAPPSPRYQQIFETRPGYPVLAAPFVAALGVNAGLVATSVLFTALGGLLAYLLLRATGAPARIALAGQALYYLCPLGWWGGYPITEGPALAATTGVLLGAWWLLQRRAAAGTIMLAGSMILGTAVKYSTFLVIGGALAAAALICLLWIAGTRHRGTVLLLTLSLACAAGVAALSAHYQLPGSADTLQDTFTGHFARRDVADPWGLLVELNTNFWVQWLQEQARAPWLFVALGLGLWGLFRRGAALGWTVLAVASTGVAAVAAHPVASESDRLMVSVWLVVVLGLPLLLRQMTTHRDQTNAPVLIEPMPTDPAAPVLAGPAH